MMEKAKTVLKTIFGYDAFISLQESIIENVLRKNDTLVLMPTGGGKSLCYQIPALLFDGLTIVISPLISLMKDQVAQLEATGVPATLLNSSLSSDQYRRNTSRIKEKGVKLVYLAPETLTKANVLALFSFISVDCIAIDEAHCISTWGHDFRPEYRQLIDVRRKFPDAVCVALTATATPRVREDIKTSLGIHSACEFVAGFDRKNLMIRIVTKTDPLNQTRSFLRKFPDEAGIIYCFTRNQVDSLCAALAAEGFPACPYHAGMSEADRNRNQELFTKDEIRIIVATIAFGMGINKSNVRFVLHYDMPQSIDSYYQEIGRAGRDGLPAECLMLFSHADIKKTRYFITQKSSHEGRVADIQFQAMLRFVETDVCRRIPLLNYFGETHDKAECCMCDNCLSVKQEKTNLTTAAQKFLSCVKRTGECFGPAHIISVLRGSTKGKVLKSGHDKLSTHGIGMEFTRDQWQLLYRQFFHQGMMIQDMEYGGLKLTPKAWEVLRGKQSVWGYLSEEKRPDVQIDPSTGNDLQELDRTLFDLLRKKRKTLADADGVPPYIIFSDKTLAEMATFFPQSKESLLKIQGVGTVRFEKYGSEFLAQISAYCREHQLDERDNKSRRPGINANRLSQGKRHLEIGEAFNRGNSVESLAETFGIKRDTVLNHLYRYLRAGNKLQAEGLMALSSLSETLRNEVVETFKTLGTDRLKPVFESFKGAIPYEELRVVCLYYLCGQPLLIAPDSRKQAPLPGTRTIVCLANSRKYSGACVAGKEALSGGFGGWIRPVSRKNTGELGTEEIQIDNAISPHLLDILCLPIEETCPKTYQSENCRIQIGRWQHIGRLPFSKLSPLCDDMDHLWINGFHSYNGFNDRIPVAVAESELTSSLCLITAEKLCLVVADNSRGLPKVTARFFYRTIKYWLTVTDPDIEKQYLLRGTGEYPITESPVYLTVSIGEPFEGFCYKLVAGIILPPEAEP